MTIESRTARILWLLVVGGMLVALTTSAPGFVFGYEPDWLVVVGLAGWAVATPSFVALLALLAAARLRGRRAI